MRNTLLLSIVVPVYNVDKYLDECLDSILKQTFKNFELIIVDDGSTDDSGKISDEYAKYDQRIKVIHKQNGGLSSARNAGINIAKGRYITFIDSDDLYGTQTTLEDNVKILEENNNIDIVQFPKRDFVNGVLNDSNDVNCLIKGKDNIYEAFYEKKIINGFVWNKIYKIELFENIRFPEGQIFEDVYTFYDIIQLVDNFYCSDFGYIKYRIRENSITTSIFTIKKYKDEFKYLKKQILILQKFTHFKNAKVNVYGFYIFELIKAIKEYGALNFEGESKFILSIKWSREDFNTLVKSKKYKIIFIYIMINLIGLKNYCSLLQLKKKI